MRVLPRTGVQGCGATTRWIRPHSRPPAIGGRAGTAQLNGCQLHRFETAARRRVARVRPTIQRARPWQKSLQGARVLQERRGGRRSRTAKLFSAVADPRYMARSTWRRMEILPVFRSVGLRVRLPPVAQGLRNRPFDGSLRGCRRTFVTMPMWPSRHGCRRRRSARIEWLFMSGWIDRTGAEGAVAKQYAQNAVDDRVGVAMRHARAEAGLVRPL